MGVLHVPFSAQIMHFTWRTWQEVQPSGMDKEVLVSPALVGGSEGQKAFQTVHAGDTHH